MRLISILAALVLVVGTSLAEKPLRVFILGGQSNMDGRGDGSKLTEDEKSRLAKVAERVRFAYNGQPVVPLQVTKPAAHVAKKFSLEVCFGPELFFGLLMAEEYPDERFLFIKRSKGGTSLYGCWNPDWSEEKAAITKELSQPKLYHELEAYIDELLNDQKEGSYDFRGMLWVQGETDSGVKKFGPLPEKTYGANLTLLISSIREHTGEPELPFVLLEVGSPAIRSASLEVSKKLEDVVAIPQSNDPAAPNYLPGYGPPVGHYNYEGMKRIGSLFFDSFQSEFPIK